MLKRISRPTWLLMAWPYSLFGLMWGMSLLTTETALLCLGLWVLATFAVCALGVWSAYRAGEDAARQGLLVKLVHIPFYMATLILGMLTFAAPPLVLGLFLLDGLLMLTTSAYGLAGVYRAYRRSLLTWPWALALTAGHLVFVLDVVCSAVLCFLLRRRKE